jgi:hypothetical protein
MTGCYAVSLNCIILASFAFQHGIFQRRGGLRVLFLAIQRFPSSVVYYHIESSPSLSGSLCGDGKHLRCFLRPTKISRLMIIFNLFDESVWPWW